MWPCCSDVSNCWWIDLGVNCYWYCWYCWWLLIIEGGIDDDWPIDLIIDSDCYWWLFVLIDDDDNDEGDIVVDWWLTIVIVVLVIGNCSVGNCYWWWRRWLVYLTKLFLSIVVTLMTNWPIGNCVIVVMIGNCWLLWQLLTEDEYYSDVVSVDLLLMPIVMTQWWPCYWLVVIELKISYCWLLVVLLLIVLMNWFDIEELLLLRLKPRRWYCYYCWVVVLLWFIVMMIMMTVLLNWRLVTVLGDCWPNCWWPGIIVIVMLLVDLVIVIDCYGWAWPNDVDWYCVLIVVDPLTNPLLGNWPIGVLLNLSRYCCVSDYCYW